MSDELFKIAVVGYGNIGKAIVNQSLKDVNDDIEVVGVVRRQIDAEFVADNIPQVTSIDDLAERPDAILYAGPSHRAPEDVLTYLNRGMATVDCFDDHSRREEVKALYAQAAIDNKTSAVMMSGWDPGFDSSIRALMDALSPEGKTITKFGGEEGGRSMGHTTTVKSIPGVKDAVSITKESPKPNKHIREVYVVLKRGADMEQVAKDILHHPYFKNDDSHVSFVKGIKRYDTDKHAGHIMNKGVNVVTDCKLSGINAVMTANMMIASARAVVRAVEAGRYGAFTIPEIAPIDMVKGKLLADRLSKINC